MTATSRDNPGRVNRAAAATLRHLAMLAAAFASAGLMAASGNLQAQSVQQPGPIVGPPSASAPKSKPDQSKAKPDQSKSKPEPIEVQTRPIEVQIPAGGGGEKSRGEGGCTTRTCRTGCRARGRGVRHTLGCGRSAVRWPRSRFANVLGLVWALTKGDHWISCRRGRKPSCNERQGRRTSNRISGDPILEDDLANAAEEMTAEFEERVKSAYADNAPLLLVAFAERGPYLIAVAHLFELDAQGKPVVLPVDRRVSPVKDVTRDLLTKAWPQCFAVKFAEKFARFGLINSPDVVCADRGTQSGAVAPGPGSKPGSRPAGAAATAPHSEDTRTARRPARTTAPRGMLDDVAGAGFKIVPGENQRQAVAPSSSPPQRQSIPQASNATATPPPAKGNSLLDRSSDRSAWKYPRFIQEAYRLGLRVLPMNVKREEMVHRALKSLSIIRITLRASVGPTISPER